MVIMRFDYELLPRPWGWNNIIVFVLPLLFARQLVGWSREHIGRRQASRLVLNPLAMSLGVTEKTSAEGGRQSSKGVRCKVEEEQHR